jgi:SAM-dependent methyltransferase
MSSGKTAAAMAGSRDGLSRLARALEVLRVEGLRSFWFKALGETVYRRVIVMECRLNEALLPVTAGAAVTVGLMANGDAAAYVAFRPDTDPADIRRRFLAGHWCFVAWHEGRIVHACWAAAGRVWIDYLARELVLPPDTVYQYDSFTVPGFRGRNISAFRVSEAARYFRAAGYGRFMAVVSVENHAAFRPLEKAGYRPVGMMGYFRLGRWRRHFCRQGRPPHPPQSTYRDEVMTQTWRWAPLDQWRAYMGRVYGGLVGRWLAHPCSGRAMKIDLFEEAVASHHLLPTLGPGSLGLDCSSATVVAARPRLRAAGGRHLFVIADSRELPLRASAFARILAGSSLDHFSSKSDIATSLAELARVLSPGGTLAVTFDNPHNPVVWLRNRLPFTWLNRLGLVPYCVGETYGHVEARTQLESLGLAVVEVTAIAHAPRAPAIWLVTLTERLNAIRLRRLLAPALDAFERLERWPTRYRTGYYLALRAEKRRATGPSP